VPASACRHLLLRLRTRTTLTRTLLCRHCLVICLGQKVVPTAYVPWTYSAAPGFRTTLPYTLCLVETLPCLHATGSVFGTGIVRYRVPTPDGTAACDMAPRCHYLRCRDTRCWFARSPASRDNQFWHIVEICRAHCLARLARLHLPLPTTHPTPVYHADVRLPRTPIKTLRSYITCRAVCDIC